MDSAFETPRSPDRRSAIVGAAWSLPVIAAAISTPLLAASVIAPCPVVAEADWGGWVNQGQGLVAPGGSNGTNGWFRSMAGVSGFVSIQDSIAVAPSSNTPLAYVITDVMIPVTPGTTYSFALQGVGRWGNGVNNANTRFQQVQINIDGVLQWQGDTRTNLLPSLGPQEIGFSYVAPAATTMITLTYRFLIPPRPRGDALGANDDIALSNPIITCA
ncbi:hypothetical protein [Microbacterium paraoxydans]|uniref:hypothetical protein n=1 Tax=Microbacterium paraoxydans TaxID=199592 RepID=UPI001CF956D2|nr:hypothetical protein [Microbacterium paraoxydans]